MITEESVLETLRRVPDRIILATMGRDLDLENNAKCLCGWLLREKIAELRNVGASLVKLPTFSGGYMDGCEIDSYDGCVQHFGGTPDEWEEIWDGVTDSPDFDDPLFFGRFPTIERAFVRRVDEACTPKRRPRKAS